MESDITVQSALDEIVMDIRRSAGGSKRIAFVSGHFNIVHPGHLRLLNFAAECCDYLVVGLLGDASAQTHVPEHLRLESLRAISVVSHALVLPVAPENFIAALRPDMVIKGKEHEQTFNPEQAVVDGYGGKLLFSSGEMRFSSMDLLQRELRELNLFSIDKHREFPARHGFDFAKLIGFVRRFMSLRVVVIGDLIVDEYITCDPLGMSQEDPTIVVTPIKRDLFIGGAGIVSAHACGLGAQVGYIGIVGDDEAALFAGETLAKYGVQACLMPDESRPTTLKQRFRARGKTLLRVSHLRQHDISHELIAKVLDQIRPLADQADLMIFSDFNYGGLPQPLVDGIISYCQARGVMMVADSQASSQVSDVSRFQGMRLITPTEREARLAVRDSTSGLIVLAETLQNKSQASYVLITLGEEGVLVHAPLHPSNGLITDQLPAFNDAPKDVSGAGDSLLTCASMALAVGANIWEAAYLGSVAAACQVGRVGNLPLSANEIIKELSL